MSYTNFIVLTFLCFVSILSAETIQIEQKSSGKKMKVEAVALEKGLLTFKTSTGKTYKLSVDKLTQASVKAAKAALDSNESGDSNGSGGEGASDKDTELFKKVNVVIGHELFGDTKSLWTEKGADIAKRLNWRLESIKKNSSSYRLYTSPDYEFIGTHPYCVTLYGGENDFPEQFSLIYANKGDFGSRFGMGPDHFKKMHPDKKLPDSLEDAMEIDEKTIAEKLTEILGEPKKQYYGEKVDKRKVQRWDVLDHSFLLSARENEYVYLLIVPKENADKEGKMEFTKDSELKKLHLTNVRKDENNDVWIDNIPMVNQGPKGYCAPATFERAMRYMLIPADMYLLATAATTSEGTNTFQLAEDCKRIVRSKARRIRDLTLKKDFKIKNLKKYIDKGVPVLWQMRSLVKYNNLATARTIERKSVTDMKAWAKKIQEEADTLKDSLSSDQNHHICMVIGYNEETNEVAVSDSWGPQFEIRWVHVDIAKAVTSRGGFVIDF